MTKKMLIDATHAEETRVAVLDEHDLLAEFDYESIVRKQLKGSIFLAKVTRVEPSLQAAFVNFGGNRHGFLPFSEIHPDYFRIPVADKEALLAEQEKALAEHDEEEAKDENEDGEDASDSDDDNDTEDEDVVEVGGSDKPGENSDDVQDDTEDDADAEDTKGNVKDDDEDDEDDNIGNIKDENDDDNDGNAKKGRGRKGGRGRRGRGNNKGGNNKGGQKGRGNNRRSAARSKRVEMVGGEGVDNDRPFRFNLRRNYKIQEVVKRGQIMLIQVSKEERGNKGAAVTSYLSLPGRYCVLMPNSPRAGGVSRKIANYKDRKRMKDVLDSLDVPKGMSVILRTAGVKRTKAEIKRDFDYLLRLWNNIRELTLKSTAPSLVYEEGNLIKRSIRDLYTRDIEEIIVSGDRGYKAAREFMKMLIPSHVKRVKEYKDDTIPLFHKHGAEKQISEIGEVSVTLKSGGYLVINQTEALVAIDVNSGKATKERHIEETALKTNLESAVEVARQLRLRDMGGLVVIDFIDMEDRRNNRKVENKLRDALSDDRARIQVGRISSFGLLELSRQRLNPSLTEAMFRQCPHCEGSGYINTVDAAAIKALRAIEDEGIKRKTAELALHVPSEVSLYILNHKRGMLADIEKRYSFKVHVEVKEELAPTGHEIEVLRKHDGNDQDDDQNDREENKQRSKSSNNDRGGRKRGRRGGRRRGGRNKNQDGDNADNKADKNETAKDDKKEEQKDDAPKKRGRPKKSDSKKEEDSGDKKEKKSPAKKTSAKKKDEQAEKDDKPKKAAAKKSSSKTTKKDEAKADKKETKKEPKKKPKASNDDKAQKAKEYETVNKEPEKKKKGWWNRGK